MLGDAPALTRIAQLKLKQRARFSSVLSQFKLEGTDDADFFYRCAGGAIRSRLVVAVAAEDLDRSLIGRMNLADRGARVGGKLLRDGARVFGRLGEQLRPEVV